MKGIKLNNHKALVDFPNVIGPKATPFPTIVCVEKYFQGQFAIMDKHGSYGIVIWSASIVCCGQKRRRRRISFISPSM